MLCRIAAAGSNFLLQMGMNKLTFVNLWCALVLLVCVMMIVIPLSPCQKKTHFDLEYLPFRSWRLEYLIQPLNMKKWALFSRPKIFLTVHEKECDHMCRIAAFGKRVLIDMWSNVYARPHVSGLEQVSSCRRARRHKFVVTTKGISFSS
jgi:hypothetical protein